MSNTMLKSNTCFTCKLKTREPDGKLLCRDRPPTTFPILAAGPKGIPQVIGHVTCFTEVNPNDWCWNHPDLTRPGKSVVLAQ